MTRLKTGIPALRFRRVRSGFLAERTVRTDGVAIPPPTAVRLLGNPRLPALFLKTHRLLRLAQDERNLLPAEHRSLRGWVFDGFSKTYPSIFSKYASPDEEQVTILRRAYR